MTTLAPPTEAQPNRAPTIVAARWGLGLPRLQEPAAPALTRRRSPLLVVRSCLSLTTSILTLLATSQQGVASVHRGPGDHCTRLGRQRRPVEGASGKSLLRCGQRFMNASALSLSERLGFGSVLSGWSVWLSVGGGLTLFVAVDRLV